MTCAIRTRIDNLRRRAEACADSISQIEMRYGTGVSPGSDELYILGRQLRRWRDEANQLEANLSLASTDDNSA